MNISTEDGLPEHGFVRTERVRQMMGISRTTLYREIALGNIPKPIRITRKLLGWPVNVIREFFRTKSEG